MLRILLACVAGATALHVTSGDIADHRILFFGCSLDRNAIMDFCRDNGYKPWSTTEPIQTAWCFNRGLNAKLAYMFNPGVGMNGDLQKPHALAKGQSTHAIITKYANATALYILEASPHLVVVDSSLWDLLVWRLGTLGGGRPMPEPKEVTTGRVQQWCKHDLPLLLQSVSEVFPTSRVAFRTAPTIDHTPTHEKFEKRDIELLYKCIVDSTQNGKLFGQYEIIDYHALMQPLIDRNVSDLFKADGYHPTQYPSALYINEVLRRVGVSSPDPPEPQRKKWASRAAARLLAPREDAPDELDELLDLI